MSIVIRPSAGVFRRSLPLVLVFGAYRRLRSPALDDADRDTIGTVVATARRLRAPIAFLREVCSDPGGAWLDGCQPKITDRVFDHAVGSAFENKEFSSVFRRITDRDVIIVGPRNDSSLAASLADPKTRNRPILSILPDHPLQKCSTSPAGTPWVLRSSISPAPCPTIAVSAWLREVCEYSAGEQVEGSAISSDASI